MEHANGTKLIKLARIFSSDTINYNLGSCSSGNNYDLNIEQSNIQDLKTRDDAKIIGTSVCTDIFPDSPCEFFDA